MTKKEWLISITVGIVLGMLGGLLGLVHLPGIPNENHS